MRELIVLLEGRRAGKVVRKGAQLQFVYDEVWRHDRDAYPLSLSMPSTARSHPHRPINAFIWGLLPDNDRTLERWAREFHVSARSSFGLIANVGEDCAGAVQFVKPDRLEEIEMGGSIEWIDEIDIARRLRSVLAEAGTGRTPQDNGQFSLAGAQPKTALLKYGNRWGVPSGRIPTTHILKPPSPTLPGHAENEHLCLSLAAKLGLTTVRSRVLVFDGQPVICVDRYDRFLLDRAGKYPNIVRLHQEDMCQAMAVHPERKYQNEGGPSAGDILRLIRESVGGKLTVGDPIDGGVVDDMWTFIDALILNWLIGGTDAHAKNYSFLLGAGGLVRLAPLYDIASAYGLETIDPRRMKLAMKVGNYYHVERILLRHWQGWAREVGLDEEALTHRIRDLAARLPDALSSVVRQMRADGLRHKVIGRLKETLSARAERIERTDRVAA